MNAHDATQTPRAAARTAVRTAVRTPGFDPWVRKTPWRREGLPAAVFLPGNFHGQRSYSPWQATVHWRATVHEFTKGQT